MKRILSAALAFCMLLSFVPVASASGTATLSVTGISNNSIKVGDNLTVTVTVPAVTETSGFCVQVEFDKDVLEVTELLLPDTVAGKTAVVPGVSDANTSGTFSVVVAEASNFDMTEDLVMIAEMQVKSTASLGTKNDLIKISDNQYYFEDENGVEIAAPTFAVSSYSATVYSEITDAQAITIAKPVKNGIPQLTVEETDKYTGVITWDGNPAKFAAETEYTATVTLTAKNGYKFTDTASATVAGAESVTEKTVAANGSTMSFKANFAATAAKELTGIAVTNKPSDLTYTHGETLNTAGMVVTATYDDGSTENVTASADIEYAEDAYLKKGDTSVTVKHNGKSAVLGGLTVSAKEVTITGLVANTRKYDGTASVTLTGGVLNGIVDGETVAVTMPTSGTVANVAVGNGKVVNVVKPVLTGEDADYYTLADISGITVNITPADYSPVASASEQDIKFGSGLSEITVTVSGIGVNGETLNGNVDWYTNEGCTTAAQDSDISSLAVNDSKTLYWKFTPAANSNYNTTAKTGSVVFTIVEGDPQPISFSKSSVTKTYGDASFTMTATNRNPDGGAITYSSSNPDVATVNATTGEVTILKNGTTTITATAAAVPGIYASGTATYTLTVNPKAITSTMIQAIASQVYTGLAIEPTVTVKDGNSTLVLGTDYTVAYSNNTAKGTATVTVTGEDNYKGTASKTFAITAKAITEADFTTLGTETKTYNGEAQTQTIETTLVLGTDYTVAYSANTNAGTAKYTITGKGNYAGSFEKEFTINAKTISEADFTVLGTESKTYNGKAQTQTITSELALRRDYTVEYSENTYVGTASYTITGTGNYTGTITKNFDITVAEYDLTRVPATLYIGSTYNPNTIKSVVAGAGDVTITDVVIYQADGTTEETNPEEAAKIAEFDDATDTITANGSGKIQITYSIAANDVNSDSTNEYAAKANQTVTVTISARPAGGGSVAPEEPEEDEKIENPFEDIKEDTYYFSAVLWAVEIGITNGTSESSFSPDEVCTRSQMVTFLWRAAGCPEPTSAKNIFGDVDADAYYYKAVLWAVEKGITNGTGEDSFSPEAVCSRAQMATFLYRSAESPEVEGESEFNDVAGGSYYEDAVVWAANTGVTNGTGDNQFSPNVDCTRAQIVTFLYRHFVEEE